MTCTPFTITCRPINLHLAVITAGTNKHKTRRSALPGVSACKQIRPRTCDPRHNLARTDNFILRLANTAATLIWWRRITNNSEWLTRRIREETSYMACLQEGFKEVKGNILVHNYPVKTVLNWHDPQRNNFYVIKYRSTVKERPYAIGTNRLKCMSKSGVFLDFVLAVHVHKFVCDSHKSGRKWPTFQECSLPLSPSPDDGGPFYQTTQRNIPEDSHLLTPRHENLKYLLV
jgi:hypothetical protein